MIEWVALGLALDLTLACFLGTQNLRFCRYNKRLKEECKKLERLTAVLEKQDRFWRQMREDATKGD